MSAPAPWQRGASPTPVPPTIPRVADLLPAWVTERREPHGFAARQALVRLRLAEFMAADYLPTELMHELTAAIDGVVQLARGAA